MQFVLHVPNRSPSSGLTEQDIRTIQAAARKMMICSQNSETNSGDAIITADSVLEI
jgi:hypothetical protein